MSSLNERLTRAAHVSEVIGIAFRAAGPHRSTRAEADVEAAR